jgi:hypothetical protein
MAASRSRTQTLAAAAHPARSRRARGFSASARLLLAGAGVVGLAGLAVAVFGPRRFAREIAIPLYDKAGAVLAPPAERLWSEVQETLETVKSEAARARLVDGLRSWLARFRHG